MVYRYMIVILFIIVFVITLLIFLVLLNAAYLRTNHRRNQFIYAEQYLIGVPKNLKLANFGSTYSKYAFNAMDKANAFNFALCAQSIEADYALFNKYKVNLSEGGIVFFVVTACSLLLGHELQNNKEYYILLEKEFIPSFKRREQLECYFPLLFNPKLVKYLMYDTKLYENIYDLFPDNITKEESEKLMYNMNECWKDLFALPDLRSVDLSCENLRNLSNNLNLLVEMIGACKLQGITPILLVPPFSRRINKYFSDEFKEFVINKNLREIATKEDILYINYQDDVTFQESYDLFCDGAFRLNRKGSELFLGVLFSDLKGKGIKIP